MVLQSPSINNNFNSNNKYFLWFKSNNNILNLNNKYFYALKVIFFDYIIEFCCSKNYMNELFTF